MILLIIRKMPRNRNINSDSDFACLPQHAETKGVSITSVNEPWRAHVLLRKAKGAVLFS